MLHALTLMAVMTVPVTLDYPEMDSTALVRFLRIQTFTLNFAMISQSSLHQLLCIYEVVPALNHSIIIVMAKTLILRILLYHTGWPALHTIIWLIYT